MASQNTAAFQSANAWYQSSAEVSRPVRSAYRAISSARRETRSLRDRREQQRMRIGAPLGPAHDQIAEVRERVTDRGHLPIENPDQPRLAHHVVGRRWQWWRRRASEHHASTATLDEVAQVRGAVADRRRAERAVPESVIVEERLELVERENLADRR